MKINDEILSAFLDGELSNTQSEEVRQAISTNPQLADRLAELASADEMVRKHAEAIDAVPLPQAIQRLLQTDNVVHPLPWQRIRRMAREHMALAASLVLATGLAMAYLAMRTSGVDPIGEQIARALDSVPSGQEASASEGASLMSRFSFRDIHGRYCRQYRLTSSEEITENVACRGDEGWQSIATVQLPETRSPDEYRTASAPASLDSTLDTLMQGDALSLAEEQTLIREGWSSGESR